MYDWLLCDDDDAWVTALVADACGELPVERLVFSRSETVSNVRVVTGNVDVCRIKIRNSQASSFGRQSIVSVVSDADVGSIVELLNIGCCAVVTGIASVGHLLDALVHARRGDLWLCPNTIRLIAERHPCHTTDPMHHEAPWSVASPMRPAPDVAEGRHLSVREREVLELLSRGLTYEDVARVLGRSPGTIQTHVKKIYRKLGVAGKAEATRYALENRLIGTD